MLNTVFLKIIILSLKIIFYSSGAQSGSVDVLQSGKFFGTISYKNTKPAMEIYITRNNIKNKFMKVKQIDNGLYSAELHSGDSFKADLAPFYIKLNWKKIHSMNKKIPLKHGEFLNITSGKNNIFLNYKKWTFIIAKRHLKK